MKDHTIGGDETIAGGAGTLLAGRYRIVRPLGQGGMGSVWLAEDAQLDGKPFAVKMLPSILVSNKRAYRQLKDEALVAMQLVHPNIVQIRAFEENDGNPFLVMDYVDGQTLDDYLAEHAGATGVPPVDVLRILRPIAAALDYAHAKGVVHRDVKPGNVMIAKDGTPYILDFGIAREIQETMTRVTGKLSSGTLLYMSPEQLMGERPRPAQDVYSFAAMAYECLKGEPPFSHGQIEFQIMNKEPEPPPGGTQLVAPVMAGLAKKPEDRPATCAAVLRGSGAPAASVGTVNGSGKSVTSPSPQQPGGSRSRATETEGPRPVAAVKGILAAALLVVLAGGAWWLVSGRTARSTGTTGVSPVATNALTGTTGVPPVVTDADVVAIAVEASVQKDRIARIDDADGFKEKKDEVSGLLTRATSYGKARRYKESAQAFSNYVEKCQELARLDVERQSALKNKAKAQEAFQIAEAAGTKTCAGSSWNTAVGVWRQASEQFGRMEFSQAGRTFSSAAELFGKCAEEVKTAKENEAATRIQKAESYLKSLQNSMADIEQVRATVANKTAPKNLPLRSRIGEAYGVYDKACMEKDRLRTIYTDLHPKVKGQEAVIRTAFSNMENVIAQALRSLTTIRQTPDALTALERDIFTFEFFKGDLPQPLQDRLGCHYEAYCKAYAEKRALRASYTEEHPQIVDAANRADAALAAFKETLWAYKNGEQASAPKHPDTHYLKQQRSDLPTTNSVTVAASTNVPSAFSVHAEMKKEIAAALASARACSTLQEAREILTCAVDNLDSAEALYERARVDDFLGWGAFVRTREERSRNPPWHQWLRRIDLLGERKAVVMQYPPTSSNAHVTYRMKALEGYRAAAARGVPAAVDALARHAAHENNKDARRIRSIDEKQNPINGARVNAGHKGVQLWEGGPYWATTNIGAEKPEDYGYYFWWGDTVGYKREGEAWVASDGSQSGFSFGKDTTSTWGKSNDALRNEGWITVDGVLAPEHDAAHVQWGGGWRMPTKQELDDLSSKCDWESTTLNGVEGYEVRGKGAYASASIFLPCAGGGYGTSLHHSGSNGYYWSSGPYSNYYSSWGLRFGSGGHGTYDGYRGSGQSVRPVQGFTK